MNARNRIQAISNQVREAAGQFELSISNAKYSEATNHAAKLYALLNEYAAHLRGSKVQRIERGEVVMIPGENPGDKQQPDMYWDGVDPESFEMLAEHLDDLPEPVSSSYQKTRGKLKPEVGRVSTVPTGGAKGGAAAVPPPIK